MLLQNIQYPQIGEIALELYMRYNEKDILLDRVKNQVVIKAGSYISFDTYFNSFSYEKWKKYTVLENLNISIRLKGCCEIAITQIELDREGKNPEIYVINSKRIEEEIENDIVLKINPYSSKGIIAFKIYAIKDTVFYGGAYNSDIDELKLEAINIALCICTYKRESYITKNIEMLVKNVLQNKLSIINDHLRVYIIDNGQTLNNDIIKSEKIKLFKNINSGGCGGFTRAIIEALNDMDLFNLTHLILMDDDVVFTHFVLERNYIFIKMLKPQMKNAMLGGGMLNLNRPSIQHAAGETWSLNGIYYNKLNKNLNSLKEIIKNEIEEGINYVAWWYCCFPLTNELRKNLSLPLFFQMDDIDFGLRNAGLQKITLNGICIWHESFDKKNASAKEYYWLRNMFYLASIHCNKKEFNKKYLKKIITELVLIKLFLYRYNDAHIILRAIEDFLKGLDWLSKQNPKDLNDDILNSVYKMKPIQELPVNFKYNEYLESFKEIKRKSKKIIRRITINGWLLKANHDVIIPVVNPFMSKLYRAKRVLNYDADAQRGFVTEKSYKEAWSVYRHLRKVISFIDVKFSKTVKRNREIYPKIITEEFWRKYLKI